MKIKKEKTLLIPSPVSFWIPCPVKFGNDYKSLRIIKVAGRYVPHWFPTPEHEAFVQDVCLLAPSIAFPPWPKRNNWNIKDADILYDIFLPIKRAVDWDNIFKVCNDGLKTAWGVDDKRFRPHPGRYEYDPENPRVAVVVTAA